MRGRAGTFVPLTVMLSPAASLALAVVTSALSRLRRVM